MTVRVISENSERIPLQASATSKRALGNRMMLPSRTADTPNPVNNTVALLEARVWSGKVICSTRVDEGIIRTRKARGNEIAARCSHPARKITAPQINNRSDIRERQNPELIVPRTNANRAQIRIIRPHQEGFSRNAASLARPSQIKNSENTGTKN